MKDTNTVLGNLAAKSMETRKAVYLEVRSHRVDLLGRRLVSGDTINNASLEIAIMTDVEVLEELNYKRKPERL